ncbi:hypothetical protein SHIRM173S_08872 [Streptomyces hirsutus]
MGDGIVLRVGRYGPYIERGEKDSENHQRADVPEDLAPDELTVEFAEELLAKPSGDFELGTDPATGHSIVAKDGRYGPCVAILPEGTPKTGKNAVKPRTAFLFKSMSLDTVTLGDALKLMSPLPRVVGTDAEGVEITAQNGRYGPYLKKGTDSRSLQSEDQLFTITLEEALAIYAQPKQRGRAAAKPLLELGEDPVSGKPVAKDTSRGRPPLRGTRRGDRPAGGRGHRTAPAGERPVRLRARRRRVHADAGGGAAAAGGRARPGQGRRPFRGAAAPRPPGRAARRRRPRARSGGRRLLHRPGRRRRGREVHPGRGARRVDPGQGPRGRAHA